jgi:hypothetical protein
MDSKAINKLIRSEALPILRKQGFTRFDSRSAFAYRGQLIDVVNFQSFNAYLTNGLGCTTFSFGLKLGVYVLACPVESHRTRDKSGVLAPHRWSYTAASPDHGAFEFVGPDVWGNGVDWGVSGRVSGNR